MNTPCPLSCAGLERLLRDGKASWVMGPSNEVLRQWVGKTVLLGMDATDYWWVRGGPKQAQKAGNHLNAKRSSGGELGSKMTYVVDAPLNPNKQREKKLRDEI